MNKLNKYLKVCLPLAALLAATAGGCHSDGEKDKTVERKADDFLAPDEVSHVTRIAEQQIANGVRTDATLRAYHFDEAALNSLGREKLGFMLKGSESDTPLVVYLDMPAGEEKSESELARARHDAVAAHLTSLGLASDRFRLESGFNPNNTISVLAATPPKGDAAAGGGVKDAKYGGGMSDTKK